MIGDFYYYFFNDVSDINDQQFQDILNNTSQKLGFDIKDTDYIHELTKKMMLK